MRLRAGVLVCALLSQNINFLLTPAMAGAADDTLANTASAPSPVLISEFQVADASSATHEFIEFYNPTTSAIDLADWKIEYRSATATGDCKTGWNTKATIGTGTIPAHGFFLASSNGYLDTADAHFSSGLATSGSIRLVDSAGDPVDALAWGTGACGAGKAAPAPGSGRSLERRPGTEFETGGNAYNTGDNASDFMQRTIPNPQPAVSQAEEPATDYTPAPAPIAPDPNDPVAGPPLEINELFPDPNAPLTDAANEFIELYNPGDTPVDISGYVIKTGATLSTKHTVEGIVPAEGYLALKSSDTKIALANAGSSVALFDPTGRQVGPTIIYPKAKPGASWARADDTWVWTTAPTPGAANLIDELTTAIAAAVKAAPSKSSTTKAKAAAAPKTTKAKTAKTAAASSKSKPEASAPSSPGGQWLLFALAGLTIAYVIYEFRYDLRDFYDKLRGYPGRSSAPRQAAAGR